MRISLKRPAVLLLPVILFGLIFTGWQAPAATAQRSGGLQVLQLAYRQMLTSYVDPLAPNTLLDEAWNGAAAAAITAGVDDIPSLPLLPEDGGEAWTAFASAFEALERRAAGRLSDKDLAYAAIEAMAQGRNECHTYFLRPDRYREFLAASEGRSSYAGIGVQISPSTPRTVSIVFPGTPAERAGLRTGDVLLAVDGVPVEELPGDALSPRVRGAEGTEVRLTVLRPGDNEPLDIVVVRGIVNIPLLTTYLRPDSIGVLNLTGFATNGLSEEQLRQALLDLEGQGATSWVLDLRGNPGGSVNSVQRVLGLFLPETTTALTFVNRDGERTPLRVLGPRLPVQRPLAVLVGPASASGGEITAAVLQDAGRARTFGAKTAGCANSGRLYDLRAPDGETSGMLITANRVLAGPRERPLDGAGLTPNEVITRDAGDPVLEAAVAYLKAGAPVMAP